MGKGMVKGFFLAIFIMIIVIGCAAYAIYQQRAAIIGKIVDYTVQSITGSQVSGDDYIGVNWLETLLDSGEQGIREAVDDAVVKRGIDFINQKGPSPVKRVTELATMADMLANGANAPKPNVSQMAQALVKSMVGDDEKEKSVGVLNARDEHDRTVLMNVCRVDVTPRVIRMLFKYKIDINAVDENGRTALMYAVALNENPEIVKLLLELGANPRIKDKNGQVAYDLAKKEEIRRMLPRR